MNPLPTYLLVCRHHEEDRRLPGLAAPLGGAGLLERVYAGSEEPGVIPLERLVAGVPARVGREAVVVAFGTTHVVAELIAAAEFVSGLVLIDPPHGWPGSRELAREQLRWLRDSVWDADDGGIGLAEWELPLLSTGQLRALRARIDVPVLVLRTQALPGAAWSDALFSGPVTAVCEPDDLAAVIVDWVGTAWGQPRAGGSSPVIPQ